MIYDQYTYLWPPRPTTAIDRQHLHEMEERGYVAQCKKNGTLSMIFVAPDKHVKTMTRHNEPHKQWTPTPQVMRAFSELAGDGWYVFVAELMHHKTKHIKEVNYVHDILVNNGNYLVGMTQEDRQEILLDLFLKGDEEETDTHIIANPNLWLPIEYEDGFRTLFESLTNEEDEGLVFKNPKAKLQYCVKPNSNANTMFKCRKPHKNYSF